MKYLLLFILSCSSLDTHLNHKVEKWFYQLQNYDKKSIDKIKSSVNSLWVIDLYKKYNQQFDLFEILDFKRNNNFIYSYLSIGEAEKYRWYFKDLSKENILYENSKWKGNYIINYWSEEWKNILSQYLDKILDAGFDGVYFDVVDVFQRWPNKKEYAEKMANLIISLSKHAKKRRMNFAINLQNGGEIINFLDQETKSKLIKSIDGLSIEAHYYDYATSNPSKYFKEFEDIISYYQTNKIKIYSLEYIINPKHQTDYLEFMKNKNILPLITDKPLKGLFFIH